MAVPTVRNVKAAGVAAVAAAVLAMTAAGCGSSGSGSGSGSGSDSAASSKAGAGAGAAKSGSAKGAADAATLSQLPARMAADGTSIVVGDAKAPNTVKVYEDPRCPYCKHFEQASGPVLAQLVKDGKVKVEYTIASFLDANFGGSSSVRAANAMRAAVEAGKFAEFHSAVFANQPEEPADGLTDAFLLKIADTVKGLNTTAFQKAVKDETHKDWVTRSEKVFAASGSQGTPTVLVNGKKVTPENAKYDAAAFAKALKGLGVN
ncbi:thioredoxin domain-containing protein [Streptomyces sp. H10-C2]|uniref:DsbA family protein n=1 Tax=unclassified Streptomyces TaxID=2593676 RepID=UPI0024B88E95|nr:MULTISPECIES: thioredoxin domain-containing protein [unclassified Streptomyces]MDJ0340370.1 thioredoxin domain-containing protein [Streptomyces sp. PH10-H1]MDJ0368182.1 thioredoxin domain-containing protein [Streptomyces sp. H10-C2]